MERTHYSEQPSTIEVGKKILRYRIQIEAEERTGEDGGQHGDYSAYEVSIYPPYSQNKLIEAAMTALYGNDYENKLINEYNAAKLGLYPDGEMEQKITRYRAFLQERAAYKAEIERICNENGIQ